MRFPGFKVVDDDTEVAFSGGRRRWAGSGRWCRLCGRWRPRGRSTSAGARSLACLALTRASAVSLRSLSPYSRGMVSGLSWGFLGKGFDPDRGQGHDRTGAAGAGPPQRGVQPAVGRFLDWGGGCRRARRRT